MPRLWMLIVLTITIGETAFAKIRLVEWHTKNTFAPLIIPVRDSETPQQATTRYLKNLSKNADLMELFQGQSPVLETVQYREISNDSEERDRRLLLQANRPGDYANKEVRVDKFNSYFKQLKQKPYLLPINPGLGLSLQEEREVFELIYEKFAIYAGMGGDDVDPAKAQQENYHSRNVIADRDAAEIRLVKDFIRRGQEEKDPAKKSFYFGTCRGSQLAAVALGYKMIQDIPFQVGSDIAHANDTHEIKLLPTTYGILKKASTASDTLQVNSLHHQSVRFVPGGFLELAAQSPDGIVEATEFKNGRGALFQFHAELMNSSLGFNILSQVIRAKDAPGIRSCSGMFAN